MTRWNFVLLAMVIGLCRAAFGAVDAVAIYNGEPALPGNLILGEWGGTRTDGQNASLRPVQVKVGTFGIPISTLGRYQGTRIDFNPPLDTRQMFTDNHVYLELYLRAGEVTEKQGLMPTLNNLRFTFFTQKGIGFFTVPAEQFFPATVVEKTWVRIDLPLSHLGTAQQLGGSLHRIIISSDDPTSFLLGRLAVVYESSDLRADISAFPAILETGQTIFFHSGADGGVTPCDAVWDFDTAAGATIDATGNHVTFTYTNPGTYLVTCTVHDVNGKRDSVTVTKEIKVSRPRN